MIGLTSMRISSLRDTCHGNARARAPAEYGPVGEMAVRCFACMVNWWHLAEELRSTEFPAWHIQMAFEVFKLPRPIAMAAETKQCLTRLAEFCKVGPAALISKSMQWCPLPMTWPRKCAGKLPCLGQIGPAHP